MGWQALRRIWQGRCMGLIALGVCALMGCVAKSSSIPTTLPVNQAFSPIDWQRLSLSEKLEKDGFALGQSVFIRIFKRENVLELWLDKQSYPLASVENSAQNKAHLSEAHQANSRTYTLFRRYPICMFSGELGPKLKTGDKQSPEGVYAVKKPSLNPNSRYHLSFDLGFPNAFDRAHGYTGSYLMVHGDCVSRGCYAMGDGQIEEIYALVEAALQAGQAQVWVHVFPFHLTDEKILQETAGKYAKWLEFWRMLQPVYQHFERVHQVPVVTVKGKRYVMEVAQ